MAKFKPAGSKRPKANSKSRGAIPCFVLIVLGIALMCYLFFLSLQPSSS